MTAAAVLPPTIWRRLPRATASPAPAMSTTAPAGHSERVPVYKRWWLWTTVGLVVVAGVGVGLGIGLTQPHDVNIPAGAHNVQFP